MRLFPRLSVGWGLYALPLCDVQVRTGVFLTGCASADIRLFRKGRMRFRWLKRRFGKPSAKCFVI